MIEKDCPKGTKVLDLPNRELVLMRGVTINISTRTLNRMLFGANYEAPMAISEVEHRLMSASRQRPWLARLLTNNGKPSWEHNTKEWISK